MKNLMPEPSRPERDLDAQLVSLEASIPGYEAPQAFGLGVATIGPSGALLEAAFPHVNFESSWGSAAVLAGAVGHTTGTATYQLDATALRSASDALTSIASGSGPHTNLDVWTSCGQLAELPCHGGTRVAVAVFIDNILQPPVDAVDAYFRLHLLSHRAVRPNTINLNGIFGLLNNVVWTNLGPFEPEGFSVRQVALRASGHEVEVKLVDKFPRMLDYVVPTGVRIADANRVRLGAHLAAGTTVMHEGYCNFNAGTLGSAMVEGRISQGVVVGDHSDIGGGASIQGTLSGGGTEVVSIGENCLLGANAGIGISLGDDCIVEAGLYLTAGTRVTFPDGEVVRARDISGASGLLFRRNSETGTVEALPREGAGWAGLNDVLHNN